MLELNALLATKKKTYDHTRYQADILSGTVFYDTTRDWVKKLSCGAIVLVRIQESGLVKLICKVINIKSVDLHKKTKNGKDIFRHTIELEVLYYGAKKSIPAHDMYELLGIKAGAEYSGIDKKHAIKKGILKWRDFVSMFK